MVVNNPLIRLHFAWTKSVVLFLIFLVWFLPSRERTYSTWGKEHHLQISSKEGDVSSREGSHLFVCLNGCWWFGLQCLSNHTHKHIHIEVPAEWSTGTFKKQHFPKAGLCTKTWKCCVFPMLVTGYLVPNGSDWRLVSMLEGFSSPSFRAPPFWCRNTLSLNIRNTMKHWKSWISNMKCIETSSLWKCLFI